MQGSSESQKEIPHCDLSSKAMRSSKAYYEVKL